MNKSHFRVIKTKNMINIQLIPCLKKVTQSDVWFYIILYLN